MTDLEHRRVRHLRIAGDIVLGLGIASFLLAIILFFLTFGAAA